MIKRPFFALLGLGAGLAIGVWTVRRLERAQRALTPDHLASVAASRASSLGGRLNSAVAVGRAAAAAKETELRAQCSRDPLSNPPIG